MCACFVSAGIHVELSRLLLDKWRWLAGAWSGRYVGARKLDALMRDWAGVEEEEEALASMQAGALADAAGRPEGQEDKEPRVLQVRTSRAIACRHRLLVAGCATTECVAGFVQVAGETVDEATLAQVLLAVLDQPDDPKAAQTQGVAISEVEAAAHHIVQRFGKSARKVAEETLQEVRGCRVCLGVCDQAQLWSCFCLSVG